MFVVPFTVNVDEKPLSEENSELAAKNDPLQRMRSEDAPSDAAGRIGRQFEQ